MKRHIIIFIFFKQHFGVINVSRRYSTQLSRTTIGSTIVGEHNAIVKIIENGQFLGDRYWRFSKKFHMGLMCVLSDRYACECCIQYMAESLRTSTHNSPLYARLNCKLYMHIC